MAATPSLRGQHHCGEKEVLSGYDEARESLARIRKREREERREGKQWGGKETALSSSRGEREMLSM